MSQKHHICICICTYKRPELLKILLSKLQSQKTDGLFDYSVIVVDNDKSESARQTTEYWAHQKQVSINYCVEPDQNIALARNRAIANASGDFLVFIDDDEFPDSEWLLKMHGACVRYASDGVLGPVKPYFGDDCPKWIEKARICERPGHATGTILPADDTRTGNVLLKSQIFNDSDNRFESQFGRTGGEDFWFFRKVIAKGHTFVWCDEAPVYEIIPPARWKASYYLKRAIRIGGLSGEEVRTKGLPKSSIFRAFGAFGVYTFILPFSFLLGKHLYMRFLIKVAYNATFLLGFIGLVIIRLRND